MRLNPALFIFGYLTAIVTAYICFEGVSWTPEEYAEYTTLNDTTDWVPMSQIGHCRLEDTDIEPHQPYTIPDPLESRADGSGDDQFSSSLSFSLIAYRSPNCPSDSVVLASVQDFGCGGRCYTISTDIESGYLWRQTTGNPSYPTVDYFSGSNCKGTKIHHQWIPNGKFSSCDSIDRARSFIVYQGCTWNYTPFIAVQTSVVEQTNLDKVRSR